MILNTGNDTEGLDLPIPEQGMRVSGFPSAHGHKCMWSAVSIYSALQT